MKFQVSHGKFGRLHRIRRDNKSKWADAQKSVHRPLRSQSPKRVGSRPFTFKPYSAEMSLLWSGNGARLFIAWYVRGSCLPSSGSSLYSKLYSFFSMVYASTFDMTCSLSKFAGCTFSPCFATSTTVFGTGGSSSGITLSGIASTFLAWSAKSLMMLVYKS